MKRKWKR